MHNAATFKKMAAEALEAREALEALRQALASAAAAVESFRVTPDIAW